MTEHTRLAALKSYQILDTEYEEKFQALVKLASIICETPIALISLSDKERQWFKAKVGIEVAETPLDRSFSLHAVSSATGVYVVEHASQHPLFQHNPLVTESPFIEFYAGIPLITPEQARIGTLCVIDSQPRKLTTHQVEALEIIARQVVLLFEYRKTSAQLTERLDSLKILEGLWKICMYCRRIEGDDGRWVQFEAHVRTRTHAEFSHGVCPDCMRTKVTPDVGS